MVWTTQSVKYFTSRSRSIRLFRYNTDIVLSESLTDARWIGSDKNNACVHCIYETSGERTVHIAVGRHAVLNLMK